MLGSIPVGKLEGTMTSWSGNGSIPVHVSPGNGDSGDNFSAYYKTDFHMPGHDVYDSLWHSFDIGPAHIIAVSTEVFYYQSKIVQDNMLDWIRADLTRANQNRENVPWIIMHYHRPAYSENYGGIHGDEYAREYLEPLTFEFGVDVVFSGHVHNQERTFPVYNGSVVHGEEDDPYRNPKAPVYIVSGNPSNAESSNVMAYPPQEWSAFRSYAFGYARVDVCNRTALHIELISSQLGGAALDQVWITKNVSCNFGSSCEMKPQEHDFEGTFPRPASKRVDELWRLRNAANVSASQTNVLIQMYNKFRGSKWFRNTQWQSVTNPCSSKQPWYGISCVKIVDALMPNLYNKNGGITSIQLPYNNLRGNLLDVNFDPVMNSLQLLDLSDNLLYGDHLPEFKSLTLYTLMIDSNGPPFQLQGSISDSIVTNLPNLKYISLQRHNFTGNLPSSIGDMNCSSTKYSDSIPGCYVWLSNNSISGHIPSSYCNATFDEFYVENNQLSCPTPCIQASYWTAAPCDIKTCVSC